VETLPSPIYLKRGGCCIGCDIMPQIGKTMHEQRLEDTLKEFEKQGYRTINLGGKSPDGIAFKDNKIIAIEVLGCTHRTGKGWHKNFTVKKKKEQYSMFDDVYITTFRRRNNNESLHMGI
jgi:hypothetical protein